MVLIEMHNYAKVHRRRNSFLVLEIEPSAWLQMPEGLTL